MLGNANTALDDQHKQSQHAQGADQAVLFADQRKDEIIMRHRQKIVFCMTVARALPPESAMRQRNQTLFQLIVDAVFVFKTVCTNNVTRLRI